MISRLPGIILIAGLVAASPGAAAPDPALPMARSALERLPLRFEANQGQWNPGVRYMARAGGYRLLLTDRGPSIVLPGDRTLSVALVGSNPAPHIDALDPLPSRTGYFVGRRANWRAGVANYSRVRYSAVYPGIDVVYYGNRNQLEYDFVVAPGADPRAIRLSLAGSGRMRVTPEGDLSLETGGQVVLQRKPIIYQAAADGSRRAIAGRYILRNRRSIGFQVGAYDPRLPLVIDPVIQYGTYFGGGGIDQVTAVKLTSRGRLYIAGSTDSGAMPAVGNFYRDTHAGTNNGTADIFVAIVDTTQPDFPLIYLSYFGGTSDDIPLAIDVDSTGFIYLAGTTTSDDFTLGGTNIQSTRTGGYVAGFVLKVDPDESGADAIWWGTYLGGTGDTATKGIVAGPDGTIYVIGTTRAADFPTTTSGYATVLYGAQDAFLAQMDPNAGALVYSTYLGGELTDDGRAIALGPDGRVYFAISTNGTLFPAAGSQYRTTLQGVTDVVVGVMDFAQSGVNSLIWDTYFGGSDADEVRRMAFDSRGHLVVTGYTLSSDFPVTADAAQARYAGNGDVFLSVLNPYDAASFLVYSTYLGGSDADVAYGVATDGAGALYVTGYTLSKDFPIQGSVPQSTWGGGVDVFVAKVQPGIAGKAGIQFSTYLGGPAVFVSNSIAVGPAGTVYVAGYGNNGLPMTGNASQSGYGGGLADGFLMVLTQSDGAAGVVNRVRHPESGGVNRLRGR